MTTRSGMHTGSAGSRVVDVPAGSKSETLAGAAVARRAVGPHSGPAAPACRTCSGGESFTTLPAPALDDRPSRPGRHAGPEPVVLLALAVVGLKSAFHLVLSCLSFRRHPPQASRRKRFNLPELLAVSQGRRGLVESHPQRFALPELGPRPTSAAEDQPRRHQGIRSTRGRTPSGVGSPKTSLDAVRARQGANGGEGGIRTHGPLARSTVFETAPFDHSGTSPYRNILAEQRNGKQ